MLGDNWLPSTSDLMLSKAIGAHAIRFSRVTETVTARKVSSDSMKQHNEQPKDGCDGRLSREQHQQLSRNRILQKDTLLPNVEHVDCGTSSTRSRFLIRFHPRLQVQPVLAYFENSLPDRQ
jgi:hypothetical protein